MYLDLHEQNMIDLNGVKPRKVRIYFYKDKIHYWFNKVMQSLHTYPYCEIYLSLDEFDGPCLLDESSVEESLHEYNQIIATHVHDEMPTTMF